MKKNIIILMLVFFNLTIFSQAVTFKSLLPGKGFSYTEKVLYNYEFSSLFKQEDFFSSSYNCVGDMKIEKVVTILEVNETEVTKIQVKYLVARGKYKNDKEDKNYTMPVEYASYIIEKKANKLVFPQNLDSRELSYLKEQYKDNNLFSMGGELNEKVINVGERIDVLEKYIKMYFIKYLNDDKVYDKYIDVNVTLKKTDKYLKTDCAFFDVKLVVKNGVSKSTSRYFVNYDLSGELIVSLDNSLILYNSLSGDMTEKGSTYNRYSVLCTIDGQGKVNSSLTREINPDNLNLMR